jgi:RND superfamily putative drug exporter
VVVHVGGATAVNQDLSDRVADRLPAFVLVVVGLSVLLLVVVFRSVVVPLVSAAFNLLSVVAAYGVVVLVFQQGVGNELIGVAGTVPIVSFIPLFMFALLFKLSMDCNVFLLSRVQEERRAGRAATEAVVTGVATTGRVISAAAVIMIAVFGAFVTDDDVITKMIGLGLAVAILIDVVLVRFLLAPAVLRLLGDRAWWLPRSLDRVLPRVAVEGREEDPAPAPVPAGR